MSDEEIWTPGESSMLYIPPKVASWRCPCGGNVFTKREKVNTYRCNSCGGLWYGQPKGQGPPSRAPRPSAPPRLPPPGDERMIRCTVCKGTAVQIPVWINPNTHEIHDDFGSFNQEEARWCETCQDHCSLENYEPTQEQHTESTGT